MCHVKNWIIEIITYVNKMMLPLIMFWTKSPGLHDHLIWVPMIFFAQGCLKGIDYENDSTIVALPKENIGEEFDLLKESWK